MKTRIVYILKSSTGPYSLRTADSAQECINDTEISQKSGYEMFRAYQVPDDLCSEAYGLCVPFVDGRLSIEELTNQMSHLMEIKDSKRNL